MLQILDVIGVIVFAISGALQAGRKRMDWFGVIVVAVVTAIGGGTVRDLLLGIRPVFWIDDPTDVLAATMAGVVTVPLARLFHARQGWLKVFDAAGLGVFTVIGCMAAQRVNSNPLIVASMGVMTGSAGGVIRDILCNEVPLIFQREIYAVASLVGAMLFLALPRLGMSLPMSGICAAVCVLVIRLSAIRWNLSLPQVRLDDPKAI